jgi:uncharacterized protein
VENKYGVLLMKRIYETIVQEHFAEFNKMIFLAGPRQVGKTTIAKMAKSFSQKFFYLSWDNDEDRQLILSGQRNLAEHLNLHKASKAILTIVFDEIHKYGKWKNFLKGFFDTYGDRSKIIVTGSSRLDVYRAGGDSLMGRYFPYRVHPLSIAECIRVNYNDKGEIHSPQKISDKKIEELYTYGGFPEPFLEQSDRFYNRWKRLVHQQLFREDIRDLSQIQELAQLELLAELIQHQAGQLTNFSNLANKVKVSAHTVQNWLKTLCAFYYCFSVKPWAKNVTRSLIKQPKIYLWDWSSISDVGARIENFVASHLLKAVHFWTDNGFGEYDLYFLRDKNKREVDFVVTKDQNPWFLVEVKKSQNASLSNNLNYFQQQIKAKHAFQVAFDMPYVDQDCFSYNSPIIVPATTFLSQLI